MTRLCGTPVLSGPSDIRVERGEHGGADVLLASHDGYAARFGIVHQRSWRLSPDGMRIDGEDLFASRRARSSPPTSPAATRCASICTPRSSPRAVRRADRGAEAADGDDWAFTAPDCAVVIEGGGSLAGGTGPRRTEQLVITGHVREAPRASC